MRPALNLLLPAIPILAFWLLYKASRSALGDRVVRSAVIWTFIAVALTEALSAFRALTQFRLALGWGLALLGVGLYALARRVRLRPEGWPRLPEPSPLCWALLVTVLLPTLAISILTLPNSWDGLTYHVARVDHWVQDRSVEFYPTFFDQRYAPLSARQNELAPLAEYIILNFRLLSGSYALANVTQWFAMIGSLISIFSIAKMLGTSERGATLAVVFGATIPMGVLQASSTQNDYCVGFWLLAFVAEFLRWQQTRSTLDLFFANAALGLAILTKGTALLFAAPFGVWLLTDFIAGFRATLRQKAAAAAMCGLCVLVPNLPHAARNIAAYGNPLGGPTALLVANLRVTPSSVAVTMIRDVALNFALPDAAANQAIVDRLADLATIGGLDLRDRASTVFGMPFQLGASIRDEGFAGNPLHTLILFSLLAVLPWVRSGAGRGVCIYAGCAVAGFVVFAALLKWQPWGSRLMLPGFLISAPLVGAMADRFASPASRIGVPALLLVGALPFAFFNETKPLIGWSGARPPIWRMSRDATMFVSKPFLEEEYRAAAAYLKQCGCNQVGLAMSEDSAIVPVFSALAEQDLGPFRVEEIERPTTLQRASYPLGPFSPSAILWLGAIHPDSVSLGGATFLPAFETKNLHVYRPGLAQAR